jgi:quercetin dioxygenase-like cupin family protein
MKLPILFITAAALIAQGPAITRTVVQRQDISYPGREAVVARVEIVPGGYAGRHSHPGEEISYVTEGELELLIDGQPPRNIKAGESFIIPGGSVHNGHNKGSVPVKFVGVYLIEKGNPLTNPAP